MKLKARLGSPGAARPPGGWAKTFHAICPMRSIRSGTTEKRYDYLTFAVVLEWERKCQIFTSLLRTSALHTHTSSPESSMGLPRATLQPPRAVQTQRRGWFSWWDLRGGL